MAERLEQIKVLIADDHPIIRDGLVSLLGGDARFRVVGSCGDGQATLDAVRQLRPDVLVLDVSMPTLNGLDVCAALQREKIPPAVLFLSMHADVRIAVQAIHRGAMGYVVKGTATQQLREAIAAVAVGQRYISAEICPAVEEELRRGAGALPNLTPRERQVLQLIGQGKDSAQIAEELGMSVNTVHVHRFNVMHKLKIESPAELAKYAFSMVTPPLTPG